MKHRLLIPSALQSYYDEWQMAPGYIVQDTAYLSGFTGVGLDGVLPADPEQQIRNSFQTIALVLSEANLGFDAVTNLTTYHVDLSTQLSVFRKIKAEFVIQPYPAWTAVEVQRLAVPGALVEIQATAHIF